MKRINKSTDKKKPSILEKSLDQLAKMYEHPEMKAFNTIDDSQSGLISGQGNTSFIGDFLSSGKGVPISEQKKMSSKLTGDQKVSQDIRQYYYEKEKPQLNLRLHSLDSINLSDSFKSPQESLKNPIRNATQLHQSGQLEFGNEQSSPTGLNNQVNNTQTSPQVTVQNHGSNLSSIGSSHIPGNRPQYHNSSISRALENKPTNAGITRGEEDSSALVSQTHGIKEIDIDVEAGGQISKSLQSSAFILPHLKQGSRESQPTSSISKSNLKMRSNQFEISREQVHLRHSNIFPAAQAQELPILVKSPRQMISRPMSLKSVLDDKDVKSSRGSMIQSDYSIQKFSLSPNFSNFQVNYGKIKRNRAYLNKSVDCSMNNSNTILIRDQSDVSRNKSKLIGGSSNNFGDVSTAAVTNIIKTSLENSKSFHTLDVHGIISNQVSRANLNPVGQIQENFEQLDSLYKDLNERIFRRKKIEKLMKIRKDEMIDKQNQSLKKNNEAKKEALKRTDSPMIDPEEKIIRRMGKQKTIEDYKEQVHKIKKEGFQKIMERIEEENTKMSMMPPDAISTRSNFNKLKQTNSSVKNKLPRFRTSDSIFKLPTQKTKPRQYLKKKSSINSWLTGSRFSKSSIGRVDEGSELAIEETPSLSDNNDLEPPFPKSQFAPKDTLKRTQANKVKLVKMGTIPEAQIEASSPELRLIKAQTEAKPSQISFPGLKRQSNIKITGKKKRSQAILRLDKYHTLDHTSDTFIEVQGYDKYQEFKNNVQPSKVDIAYKALENERKRKENEKIEAELRERRIRHEKYTDIINSFKPDQSERTASYYIKAELAKELAESPTRGLHEDSPMKQLSPSPQKKRRYKEDFAHHQEEAGLEDIVKRALIEQYIDEIHQEKLEEDEEVQPLEEQARKAVVNIASMEISEMDIFKLYQNESEKHPNVDKEIDDFKRVSEDQYISYLSQGRVCSKLIFEFSRCFKMQLKRGIDLISLFNTKNSEAIDQIIQDIMSRLKFKEMRSSYGPKVPAEKLIEGSSDRNFIFESIEHRALALPILIKIHSKSLVLRKYKMPTGTCHAIRQGLISDKYCLNELQIDNCGLSDGDLSLIIDGSSYLEHMQRLTLKNCQIGVQSIQMIQNLLNRTFPNQMLELQICRSKLSLQSQFDLFEQLCSGFTTLQKLSLVTVGLNRESIQKLSLFLVKFNRSLLSLDISCNEIASPTHFASILDALGFNPQEHQQEDLSEIQLQEINLSGNSLYDPKVNIDIDDVGLERFVAEKLKLMFKKNQQLVHANLSATGLSEKILQHILPTIKKSNSLIACHLGNNAGVTQNLVDFATEHLGIEKKFKAPGLPNFEIINPENQETEYALSTENRENLQTRLIQKQKDAATSTENQAQQGFNFVLSRFLGHHKDFPMIDTEAWRLSVKGSDKSDCWVCDRQKYSLLFWNEAIGALQLQQVSNQKQIIEYLDKMNVNFHEKMNQRQQKKQSLIDQMITARREAERKMIPDTPPRAPDMPVRQVLEIFHDRPILYSEFFNYQGVEMMTLSEYCFMIDNFKNIGDQFENLDWKDIRDMELLTPEMKQEEEKHRTFYSKDIYELLLFYRDSYRDIIDSSFDYREPNFINVQTLCLHSIKRGADSHYQRQQSFFDGNDNEPYLTYVMPQFLKSGKYNYVIRHKEKYFFHKAIVNFRREPIPAKFKQDKRRKIKNISAFTDLMLDTQPRLKRCVDHDLKHIRFDTLLPFLRGEEDGQVKIETLEAAQKSIQSIHAWIQNNIRYLKWQFKYLLSLSSKTDGIDTDTLSMFFVNKIKIRGLNVQQVTEICHKVLMQYALPFAYFEQMQRMGFVAPDKKTSRDPIKSSSYLCRKEYIEVMMHVARIEYPHDDFQTSIETMFDRIKTEIDSLEDFNLFRHRQINSQPVQQLLFANRQQLLNIFTTYRAEVQDGSKVHNERHISFNKMQRIFMVDSVPPICKNLDAVRKACAKSKQTVERDYEVGQAQCLLYSYYDFNEFLETICYVADIQSQGTPLETQLLHTKIENFLGQILRIGQKESTGSKVRRFNAMEFDETLSSVSQGQNAVSETHSFISEEDKMSTPKMKDQGTGPDAITLPDLAFQLQAESQWRDDLKTLPGETRQTNSARIYIMDKDQ